MDSGCGPRVHALMPKVHGAEFTHFFSKRILTPFLEENA